MGDSITAWTGTAPTGTLNCNSVTTGGANGYVDNLKQRCGDLEFTNLGIGGHQTSQMLSRFDNQVTNCNYNEVIILGGVNDIVSGRTATQIKNSLSSMYQQAKQHNLKVIAVTITPWKGHNSPQVDWTPAFQRVTDEVNNWILDDAQNVDVRVNAYAALEDANNPDQLNTAYGRITNLHPNQAGQRAIANAIISAAYSNACR